MQRLFHSRNFLIINIALVGVLIGFVMSTVVFSCSSPLGTKKVVYAQDNPIATIDDLKTLQSSFRSIAEEVLPAVTEVHVFQDAVSADGPRINPFRYFFEEPPGGAPEDHPDIPSLGSGVIVANKEDVYYLITNDHVAGDVNKILIVLNDGTEYTGTLRGRDPRKDIAVVEFTSKNPLISLAKLGDSDEVLVGDWVLAMGNPFGFASTVTAGIVSAKGRTGPQNNISDFIQTDASVNQGNSGGPLVNLQGEVVGINTWITTPTGINVGLAFAIPVNNVKKVVEDIIAFGDVQYGWLGVEIGDVSSIERESFGYTQKSGALIHQVFRDSPADRSGLLPGDIVIAIDEAEISDYRHLSRVVGDLPAGSASVFVVFRGGSITELEVTIGQRGTDSEIENAYRRIWPGMTVVPIADDAVGGSAQDIEGVIIRDVRDGSEVRAAGLRLGDIILEINGRKVKNLLDFYQLLNDTQTKEFDFLLNRSGEEITIGFTKR